MACVVLPSETARLVYGYLVKEKLDNIAVQFLEHSPYLTDCYHIVKSGFQFNTKFLYKELHELIQEYSTIQNLVNKKVGLLSKTSPLYKKIKLHCENLSEIIDSFLFWSNELDNEGDSLFSNKTNIAAGLTEKKTDKLHEMTVNDVNTSSLQVSTSNEYENISTDNTGNEKLRTENEVDGFQESECRLSSKFPVDKNDSDQTEINVSCLAEKSVGNDVENDINIDVTQKYNEIQASQQNTVSESSKDNIEVDISVDESCENETSKVDLPLMSNGTDVSVDNQIKIVRIEKDIQQNDEKNQLQSAFPQNLDGMETSMSIDNSSVLYVTPDVGNIINQDRNQIIVIPIDYYKGENEMENGQSQTQNLTGNLANAIAANSGIIFEDVAVTSNIIPNTTSTNTLPYSTSVEKKGMVDENIVTEGTFLKNKELIYELESKIKPQIFQEAPPVHQIVPPPTPVPSTLPTFYLTQLIEQRETGHRRILPKRQPPLQNTSVVVMQRIANNNVRTTKTRAKAVGKKGGGKKGTKKKVNSVKDEADKEKEVLNMPSIRTPASEKCRDYILEKSTESQNGSEEIENRDIIEKISEEKENVEANEKKTDTPAVIVNKNSKRLSLSTPRRRSHIRALEFETPPKTASEKKSKTSPKIKVDEIKVKNKNVRNTLFKSPDSDIIFKTPSCLKPEKSSPKLDDSLTSNKNESPEITSMPPIATREPSDKPSEAWEDVAGIGCVFGKTEKTPAPKKSWDADLRDFIPPSCCMTPNKAQLRKKKMTRKSKRAQRDDKKSPRPTKKQDAPLKKCKTHQMLTSPSKISLTAKRNTYLISGNDERSPVRSLLEELDLVTPFKDSEPSRSVEETPLTKLLRENVNGLDIDLNMINTPIFPPTPSIIITPDVDDSLSMAYYYTPLKDSGKERTSKVENVKNDFVKMDEYIPAAEPEKVGRKGTKETHEKVIDELVSKAKEIVGLRRGENEEHTVKKPLSGKVLSMVKIQMITQCDKKLCENIPINEESVNESTIEQGGTLIEKIAEEAAKFDLKCELEEKRLRALKKIKSVKENFTPQTKKKMKRSPVKRKRTSATEKCPKKLKRDSANDSSISDSKTNESSESIMKEMELTHSTPYVDRMPQSIFMNHEDSSEKIDKNMLEEIRGEFPPFQDTEELPELPVKTRKKLHYIKHFLKSEEIVKFFENCSENKSPILKLKRSHRKFFQVFYKWLRHPHAREVNPSERTKNLFKEYRTLFEKIKAAVSLKISDENLNMGKDERFVNFNCPNLLSDDIDEIKQRKLLKKEEDVDDGPVSILPLKKRKATVQPVELNGSESGTPLTDKAKTAENPTRTQTFLQDIDVDRFLSQIHGHENR